MTNFAADSFTDAAGALLSAHVGELGARWSNVDAHGGAAVVTAAGRLRPSGPGGSDVSGLYVASGVPPNADYDVSCLFHAASLAATNSPGLACRVQGAAPVLSPACYEVWYDGVGGAWKLWRGGAGGGLLGSAAQSLTAGQSYGLVLRARGGALSVLVAGAVVITVTDTGIAGAGRAGVVTPNSGSAFSDTTGYHLDDFAAFAPAAQRRSVCG